MLGEIGKEATGIKLWDPDTSVVSPSALKCKVHLSRFKTCRFSNTAVGGSVHAPGIKRHLKVFGATEKSLDALEVGSLGLPVKFEEFLFFRLKCLKSAEFACSFNPLIFTLSAQTRSTRFRLHLVSTSADPWVSAKVSLAFQTC